MQAVASVTVVRKLRGSRQLVTCNVRALLEKHQSHRVAKALFWELSCFWSFALSGERAGVKASRLMKLLIMNISGLMKQC